MINSISCSFSHSHESNPSAMKDRFVEIDLIETIQVVFLL